MPSDMNVAPTASRIRITAAGACVNISHWLPVVLVVVISLLLTAIPSRVADRAAADGYRSSIS